MYLPTYLWPVPFGTQGVRWGCLRRHRLLYHPSLLPFAAPPPVRRLCRWSRLHSIWRHGSCCPARLAGSQAQFDSTTRFSSPGDHPIQRRSRDVGGSPERPCLARGDCCPPGKGCNWAGPSSRDEAGVSQPLIHRTQERWSTTNPRSASLEPGPRTGLQRSTWRMLTFMYRSFCDTDRSYGLRSRVGHGSTGSSPSGSPCLPVTLRRS